MWPINQYTLSDVDICRQRWVASYSCCKSAIEGLVVLVDDQLLEARDAMREVPTNLIEVGVDEIALVYAAAVEGRDHECIWDVQ